MNAAGNETLSQRQKTGFAGNSISSFVNRRVTQPAVVVLLGVDI